MIWNKCYLEIKYVLLNKISGTLKEKKNINLYFNYNIRVDNTSNKTPLKTGLILFYQL